jgi:hypothetical protein
VSHPAAAVEVVPSVRLDDDLRERGAIGPIKLLKLDVEGHEAAVLRGSVELLASGRVHAVVLEVTPGETAATIDEVLRRLDATVESWLDGRWQPCPVAEIPYRTDILVRF